MRVAPASAALAWVTCAAATAIFAWSAATYSLDAPADWSEASRACALASDACADATALLSTAESIVASFWPRRTL